MELAQRLVGYCYKMVDKCVINICNKSLQGQRSSKPLSRSHIHTLFDSPKSLPPSPANLFLFIRSLKLRLLLQSSPMPPQQNMPPLDYLQCPVNSGISTLIQRVSIAWLPRNLFMFIFGQGFVSPAIAVSLTAAAALGVHITLADGSMTVVPVGYAFSVLLLATGEAWFTGMSTADFPPSLSKAPLTSVFHHRSDNDCAGNQIGIREILEIRSAMHIAWLWRGRLEEARERRALAD